MVAVHLTDHAYKRYRQRVGRMPRQVLSRRIQTAAQCGLYKQGEALIKIYGVWWGCKQITDGFLLTTCYGRQGHDMIAERRRGDKDERQADA